MTAPKKKKSWWVPIGLIGTIIITACLAFLWRNAPDKKAMEEMRRPTVRESANTSPLIMTTTSWNGRGIQPGKRINAWPIRNGVTYKVRLDKDDRRVVTIAPGGAPSTSLAELGDSRYIEFRLCSSNPNDRCEIIYEFVEY